ncbi:MAG: DUF1361 domain-containing protein [Cyanobacteria bacterium P01_A01_bin.83]
MVQLIDWLQLAFDLFSQSIPRITWNLFLALIPLVFSFYLFRPRANLNLLWWIIFLLFVVFLPNAPYVLTDSIHIIELSQNYPVWGIILILIPQYTLFIMAGFQAYVFSLIRLEQYLANLVSAKYLLLVNLLVHGLCAVGIYIGRFERFNSWDFVTKPVDVIATIIVNLMDIEKLFSMAIALIIIGLLAEFTKLVNYRIGLTETILK